MPINQKSTFLISMPKSVITVSQMHILPKCTSKRQLVGSFSVVFFMFLSVKDLRDLVYKLKKIVGSNNFSEQFIKIISHYKKIGYNINVLR